MKSFLLSVLFLLQGFSLAGAFLTPQSAHGVVAKMHMSPSSKKFYLPLTSQTQQPKTKVELWSRPEKDDETFQTAEDDDNESNIVVQIFRKIFTIFADIYSVFVLIFGSFFACGLLLNLCGYGYSFNRDGKFQVDTIQNMRVENQMQREFQRMGSDKSSSSTSESQPPSSLPK